MSSFAAAADDNMDAGVAFVVKKLKAELAKRGAKGMVGLGRKFKIMDVRREKGLLVDFILYLY